MRRLILFLVSLFLWIIEALLVLRIILKLFGANIANGFVRWIYDTTAPLVSPFEGIFPTARVDGFVIEFSSIFALIVYAILAYIAIEIIKELTYRSDWRERSERERYRHDKNEK